MGDVSVVAKRLRQARLRVGLSQQQLGIKAGIDRFCRRSARINQYERGQARARHLEGGGAARTGTVRSRPFPVRRGQRTCRVDSGVRCGPPIRTPCHRAKRHPAAWRVVRAGASIPRVTGTATHFFFSPPRGEELPAEELQRVPMEMAHQLFVTRLGSEQQSSPDCGAIIPSRAHVPEALLRDAIDLFQRQVRDHLRHRCRHAEKDRRGRGSVQRLFQARSSVARARRMAGTRGRYRPRWACGSVGRCGRGRACHTPAFENSMSTRQTSTRAARWRMAVSRFGQDHDCAKESPFWCWATCTSISMHRALTS